MPTPYVASIDGEWDASVTNTWGQGIGVYPNTAGDVVTIGAGRTVTYNKVSTVELGAMSITGLLTFSAAMSTKLTMSHNDITVNSGGELRIGASGAIIPKTYLAELIWNTTADNAKGISIANGGKLTVYGDPAYFGSDYDTVLTAQAVIPAATNPITLTVAGDFTSDGNAEAISAMTRAADCSITWTLHGLTAGDKFTIADIAQADWTALNGVQTVKAVTDANTITIETDTSGYAADYLNTDPGTYTRPKWKVGQELIVHKGGTYASYINDFCRLAITSLAVNGANTDIACTVTERPAALTCLVGADVLNVSRNVLLYKLSYNANLGQLNTLRPKVSNANVIGNSNININDAMFAGWYQVGIGYNFNFNGVARNGNFCFNGVVYGIIQGIIFSGGRGLWNNQLSTCDIALIGCSYGIYGCTKIECYGKIYGNSVCIQQVLFSQIFSNVYSNNNGVSGSPGSVILGSVGYNAEDLALANVYDFDFGNYTGKAGAIVLNSKIPNSPAYYNRNNLLYPGRYNFEHYQQVANAHYIADAYGDITKMAADGTGDNPTQRSGGSADVIEAVPQSNCAAASYLELLNIRLWAVAGVSKTYRFYVQTDFVTLPTAELTLYGDYLDQGSGGHLATVSSTQDITTRANAADWSQYVEVTMNPAQTGYVNLYMRLMGYEAAKKIWIDPMVVINGGDAVTVTPYWSYGDAQLDIDPVGGGGVFPIIGGGHIIQPARAA